MTKFNSLKIQQMTEANTKFVNALWTSLRTPTAENVKARQEAGGAYEAASK